MKVEATEVDGRKIFSVRAFNQGVGSWLERLPTVWVEGEVTELRRQDRWASVFFTLKDPENGACLSVQMPRGQFDGLRLGLADGERVHVYGRPELYEQRGEFHLRALTIERFGLGAHLASLERLKAKLAGEGLFAAERKRKLPRLPRLIGLVTGNDAAAKRDVLTAITTRFPPAHVLVAETWVQGPRAAPAIVAAIADLCAEGVDVIVVARGGGSFEDLLAFSDERLVRAVAACPVPVVSAVGHEQDTPLLDLAADVRASTPSVAGRLVVPDLDELRSGLERARAGLERGARRIVERRAERLRRDARPAPAGARALARAPARPPRGDPRPSAGALATCDDRPRLCDRPDRRAPRPRAAAAGHAALGGGRGWDVWSPRRVSAPSFEESQAELERIVERLERGDVELEELTQLWQRGEELYHRCAEQLAGAQGRIDELAKRLGDVPADE